MRSAVWLAPLAMSACAGSFRDAVRLRAATDFDCPGQQVSVKETEPVALARAYRADGCGKSASYEGDCGILFCSVYTSESQKQRRAAMRTAAAARPQQPGASLASAPEAPQMVSFSLHNRCSHQVTLFYGDHPQRSSGTQSYIGANSTESKFMRPGSSIWILDKDRNPVSVYTVSPRPESMVSMNVDIIESCSGFVVR